jgi:flagellar motor protein MotB
MKLIGVLSTAVLSLTLGVASPMYAQQEQHEQKEEEKAKPEKNEKKAQPEKAAKQEQKPAAQHEKNAKPEEKNVRQQENNTKQEEKSAQQQHAQHSQPAQQHAANRIPEERFKANFGQEHRFHVSQADYSRDRRFQYGGYWFGFADPWPSNWLYTQDVYVVEINGMYFLCNPMYPGVNIALNVTL